jgi:RimJ/RimL family protein N-acetyltransferase
MHRTTGDSTNAEASAQSGDAREAPSLTALSVAQQRPVRLAVPTDGIRAGDVILRFPALDHVDALLPAFTDPELREAGNLPAFDRDALTASIRDLPTLAEQGRLLALAAVDARNGDVVGGGTLHHLDAERRIVEIGYFALPHARRRGIATTIARLLSQHAFSLGIERVAAYVNVGNVASERVVERAGFSREGVVRSMPKPDGRRVDKTLVWLLPGEDVTRRATGLAVVAEASAQS